MRDACQNCAEPVVPEAASCQACGWAIVAPRPRWQRVPEMLGLLAGLALMAGASLGLQYLFGL